MSSFVIQDLNHQKDIGANCMLVECGKFRFLIDAGMDPKELGEKALPKLSLLPPNSIDFIIITHCHFERLQILDE